MSQAKMQQRYSSTTRQSRHFLPCLDKLNKLYDKDHKCPVCKEGGDWEHRDVVGHMEWFHDFYYEELDLDHLQAIEETYKESLIDSENETSRSDPPLVASRKSKSSSDDSSDSSSSHSQSGKPKVRKSWAKRNAAVNDEKIR